MLPPINPTEPPATSVKPAPNGAAAVKGFFTLLIVGAIIWYLVSPLNSQRRHEKDAVDQYDIVKRHGSSQIEICVDAGLVSAAFLQAKDEDKYKVWKAKEQQECAAAGLPSYPTY